MTENSTLKGSILGQVFPSIGIGLLVGMLVGMSVSPVVSGVLASLGGLLAALLGLQQDGGSADSGEDTPLKRVKLNGVRIGSFGFACVAGILIGVFIRAQDVFSIPAKDQIAKWEEAGYSKEQAQQFVIYQKLGLKPEGKEIAVGETQKAQSSSLFNVLADADVCSKISMKRYNNDVQEVLQAYRRLNSGDNKDEHTPLYRSLGSLADRIASSPARNQGELFNALEEVLCELAKLK